MTAGKLVLFGKHPAWSDHMFVSNDTVVSNYLKRVFYDHSVIPALQGGEGDRRISETWSFLVSIEGQNFFIVNSPSRDSVGRRLFPLIAAYSLPGELVLKDNLNALRDLKRNLLLLLTEILETPNGDLDHWQEVVAKKSKLFLPGIDWATIDGSSIGWQLKRDKVSGLLSRLVDGYDSFDLELCTFENACSFLKLGLKQFQSSRPIMLILDNEERGIGLFFATGDGTSFDLKRCLHSKLTSLVVSTDNISSQVKRLLDSNRLKNKPILLIDEIPLLRLGGSQSIVSRKLIALAVASIITVSVLFGVFSCSENGFLNDNKSIAQPTSDREKWILNSTAYINWVQPLIEFVEQRPGSLSGFRVVRSMLDLDLDPFAVVGSQVSQKLAKKPKNKLFSSSNVDELETIYANIEKLKVSLTSYYKKQFSSEFVKELKRQNYPVPSFIEVDFSQQPILPDFGPELIDQLKLYTNNRNVLREIVLETKVLWNSIIKPLHEFCPRHAKFIQRYMQNLISTSEDFEQFRGNYLVLSKLFGYPKYMRIDTIDLNGFSKDGKWQGVLDKEQPLESIKRLADLLKANYTENSDPDEYR